MKINKIKNTFLTGIASIILGFSSSTNVKAQELDFNWRVAYSPRYYSLNLNESKSIPVHPGDSGFLSGNTDVKAGNGLDFRILDLGAEARLKNKKGFSIFLGADLELDLGVNELSYSNGERSDSGMFTSTQQSSDTRPESSGSFVYDKLNAESASLIPFIGVGYKGKEYFIDLEYSPASRKFERKWGHHRFNTEEKIGSENITASGNRFAIRTGIFKDDINLGLQLMHENYRLEDSNKNSAGRLKSYSLGICFTKSF